MLEKEEEKHSYQMLDIKIFYKRINIEKSQPQYSRFLIGGLRAIEVPLKCNYY